MSLRLGLSEEALQFIECSLIPCVSNSGVAPASQLPQWLCDVGKIGDHSSTVCDHANETSDFLHILGRF